PFDADHDPDIGRGRRRRARQRVPRLRLEHEPVREEPADREPVQRQGAARRVREELDRLSLGPEYARAEGIAAPVPADREAEAPQREAPVFREFERDGEAEATLPRAAGPEDPIAPGRDLLDPCPEAHELFGQRIEEEDPFGCIIPIARRQAEHAQGERGQPPFEHHLCRLPGRIRLPTPVPALAPEKACRPRARSPAPPIGRRANAPSSRGTDPHTPRRAGAPAPPPGGVPAVLVLPPGSPGAPAPTRRIHGPRPRRPGMTSRTLGDREYAVTGGVRGRNGASAAYARPAACAGGALG